MVLGTVYAMTTATSDWLCDQREGDVKVLNILLNRGAFMNGP